MSRIACSREGTADCLCSGLSSKLNSGKYRDNGFSKNNERGRSYSHTSYNQTLVSDNERPHTSLHLTKPARPRASMGTRPRTCVQKPIVEIRIEDFDLKHQTQDAWAESDESERQDSTGNPMTSTPRSFMSSHHSTPIDSTVGINTRASYVGTSSSRVPPDGANDLCIRLPSVSTENSTRGQSSARVGKNSLMVKVPPFVQVEALNPGKVFVSIFLCLVPFLVLNIVFRGLLYQRILFRGDNSPFITENERF